LKWKLCNVFINYIKGGAAQCNDYALGWTTEVRFPAAARKGLFSSPRSD